MSTITVTDPQTLAIAATNESALQKITTWDALAEVCSQNKTEAYIKSQTKTYYSIDVSVAMKELTNVGTFLQTAFAGTKGYKSNAKVARILANYQSLIKDSNIVSATFVETCLLAIKYHRMVLVVAEKPNGLEKALKIYSKCADTATRMAKESEKLVMLSDSLIENTKEALETACDDGTMAKERKEKVKAMIADLEAKKAQLEDTTQALHEQVDSARERELNASRRADQAEQRAFITGLVSCISGALNNAIDTGMKVVAASSNPVAGIAMAAAQENTQTASSSPTTTNGSSTDAGSTDALKEIFKIQASNNAQIAQFEGDLSKLKVDLANTVKEEDKKKIEKDIAEKTSSIASLRETAQELSKKLKEQSDQQQKVGNSAREAEMQAAQERANLQKQLREQNGELKKSLQLLSSTNEEKNYVEQAITALEVSIKSLGRVVTIFGNTKLFWEGVKKQCNALAGMTDTASDWVDMDCKEEFINEIKLSALNWLSLGNITRIAALSMIEVNGNVDKIMSDLPTQEESNDLIKKIVPEMIEELEKEDNQGLLNG